MWQDSEVKNGSTSSDARNDILARSLGKIPRCGHMQGVGKFVTPSIYFHSFQRSASIERYKELKCWKDSVEARLEDMKNALKKTPRKSNAGSSIFPPVIGDSLPADDGKKEGLLKKHIAADICRRSPRLKITKLEESVKGESKKQLQFDSPESKAAEHIQVEDGVCLMDKPPLEYEDKKKKIKIGKQIAPQPTRKTRNNGVKHQNRLPILALFGSLCEMKLPTEYWLPYLIADNVFEMKEVRSHIGKQECKAMMTMDVLGVNCIEIYIS